jgi:CRP-like cAMP-binding protein
MATGITLEEIINFLLEAPMFGDLDPTELSQIVQIMQVQKLRAGQFLFREGDPGDAWYVLYEGTVEVAKEWGPSRSVIAELGSRACFGEMAVLDGSARSASVRALGDVTAFRFPRVAFDELVQSGNLSVYKLIYQMALVLVARQRDTTTRLAELVAVGSASLRDELAPIVGASVVAE